MYEMKGMNHTRFPAQQHAKDLIYEVQMNRRLSWLHCHSEAKLATAYVCTDD